MNNSTIRAQLAGIWELSSYMTAAEKADLAASLDSFPVAVFSGMDGLCHQYHREILKGRLTGNPSMWDEFFAGRGYDIDALLRGEEVWGRPRVGVNHEQL